MGVDAQPALPLSGPAQRAPETTDELAAQRLAPDCRSDIATCLPPRSRHRVTGVDRTLHCLAHTWRISTGNGGKVGVGPELR